MKCKMLYSFFVVLLAFPVLLKAQTINSESIYQNWKMIGESPTNYEVSARIIRCNPDSAAQLHIELFNEGATAQTAHFNITISNPATNETMVKEISYPMDLGAMVMPKCNNKDFQSLRINLPSSWSPPTIKFSLSFIP